MASRGTIVVDTPTAIVIRIDHTIFDSFSRSVYPTSTRAWRRAVNYGRHTSHRVGSMAPSFTVDDRQCASFTAFGPSFPAAEKALEDYLALIQGLTTAE